MFSRFKTIGWYAFICVVWVGLTCQVASSSPKLGWQQEIKSRSQGIATKILSASEIDPEVSNKHSFHGIVAFRELLGEKRITLHSRFLYISDDEDILSESFVTWYDDCEGNPNPECKNHWRMYYPDTRAISKARTGDMLLVARMENETLFIVLTPPDSTAAAWIKTHYKNDERLEDIVPPLAEDFRQAALPQSFSQAKKLMTRDIYADQVDRKTLYCGCNYSIDNRIDPLSCGYTPRRAGSKRAERLEWEHIVPAFYIGKGRPCWEQGDAECVSSSGKAYKGRRCCNKVDKQFRRIVADLNNIVPSIGEINADRNNFPHREIAGEERVYGACDFEVDFKARTAEPAVPLRGFIGRTWLYMHDVYDVILSDEDKAVYKSWAEAFPPAQWELDRTARIQKSLSK